MDEKRLQEIERDWKLHGLGKAFVPDLIAEIRSLQAENEALRAEVKSLQDLHEQRDPS